MSFFKKLLPVAGAAAGFFGLGPIGGSLVNAALGSGIGTLLAGGDVGDAVKNAALAGAAGAGLGAFGVTPGVAATAGTGAAGTAARQAALLQQSAGPSLARAAAMEPVTAAAGQAAATKAATSGIAGMLTPGNLALAGIGAGLLAEEPEMPEPTELQRRQMETGERLPDREGRNIVREAVYNTPRTARNVNGVMMAAEGGYIQGPGTGRSDDVKAGIFQDGMKVQEARLSDGEFVMTERAVRGLGNGDRSKGAAKMYEMMRQYERMA